MCDHMGHQAHQRSVATPICEVASDLVSLLGQRGTAQMAGLRDAQGVAKICLGTRKPHADTEKRLRAGYQTQLLLKSRLDDEAVRAWLESMNPLLGYVTPLEALGDLKLREVITAAEEFLRAI